VPSSRRTPKRILRAVDFACTNEFADALQRMMHIVCRRNGIDKHLFYHIHQVVHGVRLVEGDVVGKRFLRLQTRM
jgi:hypothetical protein